MEAAKKVWHSTVVTILIQIELLGTRQSMIHQDHDGRATDKDGYKHHQIMW